MTIFFILVLVLTCSFGVVDALGSHGILPFRLTIPLLLIQGHMPTLAAVIFVGMEQGREGIRALFRKLLIARVDFRWYLFAIFGMAVISIAAILLTNYPMGIEQAYSFRKHGFLASFMVRMGYYISWHIAYGSLVYPLLG